VIPVCPGEIRGSAGETRASCSKLPYQLAIGNAGIASARSVIDHARKVSHVVRGENR
jgi:hypothetical protein